MKKFAIFVFVLGLIASCCGQTVTPTEVENDSIATDSIEVVDSISTDSVN